MLTIYTDGAARGNPGPAAFGYVIERPGETAVEASGYIGEATNNQAEYIALIRALARARELGHRNLVVYSDSELIVNQMNGAYKVKHPHLVPLHQQAKALVTQFEAVTIRHINREQNQHADRLCSHALGKNRDAKVSSPLQHVDQSSGHEGARRIGSRCPGPSSKTDSFRFCIPAK
jgi:ribonuclease HI